MGWLLAIGIETWYCAHRKPLPARLASACKAAYIAVVQAKTALEDLALRQ